MGRTSKSPETEVVTLRAALIAGVTVVAGGLILWWSTAWTSSEPMAAFLGQLGGLLVATGLLAVAWDVFGRRAFAREVLAKARLRARADRTAYGSGAPGRTRVPPVALPGLPDQAADDDDRAGQRHPGVLHAPLPVGHPRQRREPSVVP